MYHRCVEEVLQEFLKLQEEGGMDVFVRIGPYVKMVKAKFPVAIIVGDAKSGDLWTCRILHHRQNRMSCACYTPSDKCSDQRVICRWVKQSEQEKLLQGCMDPGKEKDLVLREKLKMNSTIRCYSCLFRMDFGANPHRQFRACTYDMMHLFENGWVSYVYQVFIHPMRTLNCTMLDLFVEKVFKGSHSSHRKFFPRTNFSGGIKSLTQLASHKWIGVLLTILMAAQTHMGARILSGRLHGSDTKFLDHAKSKANKCRKKKHHLEVLDKENLLQCNEQWDLQNQPEDDTSDDEDEEDLSRPLFGHPDLHHSGVVEGRPLQGLYKEPVSQKLAILGEDNLDF
jgi:hypothetical protein